MKDLKKKRNEIDVLREQLQFPKTVVVDIKGIIRICHALNSVTPLFTLPMVFALNRVNFYYETNL